MKIEVGKFYRCRSGSIEYIKNYIGPSANSYECWVSSTGKSYDKVGLRIGVFGSDEDLSNEVEVTDINPPLEIKEGDHVRTDKGFELGPVELSDDGYWVGFFNKVWTRSGGGYSTEAGEVGNIIEVTKRGSDE